MASSNTEHPYSNLSWNIPERKGYERVRSLWTKRQTIYRPPKQKLQQCHTLEPSNTKKPEHTKMTNYIFVEIETKTMSAETQHLKPDNNKKISFSMKQNKKKKREKWRRKPHLLTDTVFQRKMQVTREVFNTKGEIEETGKPCGFAVEESRKRATWRREGKLAKPGLCVVGEITENQTTHIYKRRWWWSERAWKKKAQ